MAPISRRISQSCAGTYAAEVLVLRLLFRWIIHPEGAHFPSQADNVHGDIVPYGWGKHEWDTESPACIRCAEQLLLESPPPWKGVREHDLLLAGSGPHQRI